MCMTRSRAPRGRGGLKASIGFCNVQFLGLRSDTTCVGPPTVSLQTFKPKLPYCITNCPTALLPTSLFYVVGTYN